MNKQTKHELDLKIARVYVSIMSVWKSIWLNFLIFRYGGKDKVPVKKLGEWMGPMDEIGKSIGVVGSIMDIAKMLNLDFMKFKLSYYVGLHSNGLLTDVVKYEMLNRLRNSKTKNKDVLDALLAEGDIQMHQLRILRSNPEMDRYFDFWLTQGR